MKGDITRSTFKKENRYHGVRMQQGRVQMDADWNEQLDIQAHRTESETLDTIGKCGVPMHHPGFHLVSDPDQLSEDEKAMPENQEPSPLEAEGDFFISGGRLYAGGILCENHHMVPYSSQPDMPGLEPVSEPGAYLAYLDVWQRHITALENDDIREKALGGPDTATRSKTLWQVKMLHLGEEDLDVNCLSHLDPLNKEIAPGDGTMAARAEKAAEEDQPCSLTPEAGYRRLENQLYRVEVHKGGTLGTATFKWSRDNGTVVARWEEQDSQNKNKLSVSSIGKDDVLNFATGHWVELSDDLRELKGKRGILVQLENVQGNVLTIKASTIIDPDNPGATEVDFDDFTLNPKVRRWDSDGEVLTDENDWIDLEDGIQVVFSGNEFKTGDYWLIPARTVTADIEWPRDPETKLSLYILPHGIRHDYCRLAIMRFNGSKWTEISDCRNLFPPITQLTSLFYVSGDGQEAMPGHMLPKPLQVGVSNGQWPLAGIPVAFDRISAGGALDLTGITNTIVESSGERVVMLTDDKGIAQCNWLLDDDQAQVSQQVEALMLNVAGDPVHLPVRFNANLSVAEQVAYTPDKCNYLKGKEVSTVHEALEELCAKPFVQLFYVGGDGQEAMPGKMLPKPLQVGVSNANGGEPVESALVSFLRGPGGGTLKPTPASNVVSESPDELVLKSDGNGIAECDWQLDDDPANNSQRVVARLVDEGGQPLGLPVHFNANLSQARDVAFKPDCLFLKGKEVSTVKEALEELCEREVSESKGCSVTVGPGGMFDRLDLAIATMLDSGETDICICLMPGDHQLPVGLLVDVSGLGRKPVHIKIKGCGQQSRVYLHDEMSVRGVTSFVLEEVYIIFNRLDALKAPYINFDLIKHLKILSCQISGNLVSPVAVMVARVAKVEIRDNIIMPLQPLQLLNVINTLETEGFTRMDLSESGNLVTLSQPMERLTLSSNSLELLSMTPTETTLALSTGTTPGNETSLSDINRLSTTVREDRVELINTIFNEEVDRARITELLAAEEAAAPGDITAAESIDVPTDLALVILDGSGQVIVDDNIISPNISIYGAGSEDEKAIDELKNLGPLLSQDQVKLVPGNGFLHMRGNQIQQILLGKTMHTQIRQLFVEGKGDLPGVFRRFLFADNIVAKAENNIWLAYVTNIDQNYFAAPVPADGQLDLGISIAHRAALQGNQCEFNAGQFTQSTRLFSVTGNFVWSQVAANFVDVQRT